MRYTDKIDLISHEIVQSAIALIVTVGVLAFLFTHNTLPQELTVPWIGIVGFYFGRQTTPLSPPSVTLVTPTTGG